MTFASALIAWTMPPRKVDVAGTPAAEHRLASPSTMQVSKPRTTIAWLLAAAAILHFAAAIDAVVYRRVTVDLFVTDLRLGNADRLLALGTILLALSLAISPVVRSHAAAFMRSRGFFLLALIAAMWLSLGPTPQSLGRPLDLLSPYRLLYDHVPGFDGLRVPARFGTIVVLMLAVLAGFGADTLSQLVSGRWLPALVVLVFLAESVALPMPVNGVTPPPGLNTPDTRLYRPARAPAVYRQLSRLPSDAVIAELPLGQPDYDLRAMYYSIAHWRRLINGYSGFFPPYYGQIVTAVSDVPRHPEIAVDGLRAAGATHVVVHESAYLNNDGPATSEAFRQRGATELFRGDGDVLLSLATAH